MTDILLIEDDDRLGSLIADYLAAHGFRPAIEPDGLRAADAILAAQPDVVLLDINLPGRSGFDVCRAVRAQYGGLICMLTAHDEDVDQILGLELGADDYVAKPVEPRVLLARLRALLRRRAQPSPQTLAFGSLRIDLGAREVTLEGSRVGLTTAEFDLLVLLARHAGEIVGRDTLLRALRGIDFDGLDRSIDARVSRLRRKLGDGGPESQRIKTVRNRGYLFSRHCWN
ncbi:MAG TPA: winged helix-turn-helix domain-containing protein [Stenotrophomonas sp.]|nr:winged helix-turn-helix domain-containing protein [Stenotrophomonas sp.]